jgi:hypothetical protein
MRERGIMGVDACRCQGSEHCCALHPITRAVTLPPNFSGLVATYGTHTTAFQVRPVRRVARRDAGASQAPRNDIGGLGRPPCGSRLPRPRGVRRA